MVEDAIFFEINNTSSLDEKRIDVEILIVRVFHVTGRFSAYQFKIQLCNMTASFKILVTETIISHMNIVVCEINCALKKDRPAF